MENLSSWIWLVVALIWFGTRILPRLFRRKEKSIQAEPPKMIDRVNPEPQGPTGGDPGAAASFDTLVSSLGRSRGATGSRTDRPPPPIEPR